MSTGTGHAPKQEFKIGPWSLWALGVGAFIGGDFIGWPSVLDGGIGSALVIISLIGAYFWMIGKITGELSARYREPGGTYMFCNKIFGKKIGSLAAVLQSIKLLTSNCCMALAISSYLQQITFHSTAFQILIWVACYFGFTALDIVGIQVSARLQISIVALCLVVMMCYFSTSLFIFDFDHNATGHRGWFHSDANQMLLSLPFGLWFMDGFEDIPLAVDYAEDSATTVPIALNMAWTTAMLIAVGLIIFGSASTPFHRLSTAPAPLMLTFQTVWGNSGPVAVVMDICIILGLAVNFYSFVFFIGRTIQAVAQNDVLPSFLAENHPKYNTAANASVFSSVLGFTITLSFGLLFGEAQAQEVLIASSLLGGIITYLLIFNCLDRVIYLERQGEAYPFKSCDPGSMRFPLGVVGIRVGQAISVLLLISTISLTIQRRAYQQGTFIMLVGGAVVCLVLYVWQRNFNHINCNAFVALPHDDLDCSAHSTTPLKVERFELEMDKFVDGEKDRICI